LISLRWFKFEILRGMDRIVNDPGGWASARVIMDAPHYTGHHHSGEQKCRAQKQSNSRERVIDEHAEMFAKSGSTIP
jgi:hypothetical protein